MRTFKKNTTTTTTAPKFNMGGGMPGGPMPGGAGAPPMDPMAGGAGAPPAGPDPMGELMPLAESYATNKDPQVAMQIADMVVQMLGVGPAGGANTPPPAPAPPMGGDPMAGGDPAMMARQGGQLRVYRRGGGLKIGQ